MIQIADIKYIKNFEVLKKYKVKKILVHDLTRKVYFFFVYIHFRMHTVLKTEENTLQNNNFHIQNTHTNNVN